MPDPSPPSRALTAATLLAAASSGGATLALELWAAARLAPVFGSGLDVWSSVLAVTFGALALGYVVGSLRTSRWATPGRAALLFAAGAAAVRGATDLADTRLETIALGAGSGVVVRETTLLLAPPIVLLAVLGPWLVELHHRGSRREGAGRSAGLTYAASTIGGVLCALGAGLHALPHWGLERTALGIAGLLAFASLALAAVAFTRRPRDAAVPVLLLLAAAGPAALVTGAGESLGPHVLTARTSLRGRLVVTDDGLHRTLWANGIPQTRAPSMALAPLLDDDLLAAGNALGVLGYLRPNGGDALVVGLGGGTVAQALAARGWDVEAVELDPQVVALARTYFGYEGPCVVMDGRRYLRGSTRRYDLVVVDVYRGEDLPPHLVTREFFDSVRSHLADGGLLALNLIGRADAPDVAAVLRTVRAVFPEVALLATHDDGLVPMTLLAAIDDLEDESTRDRLRAAGLAMPRRVDLEAAPADAAPLLTDDQNPIALLRRPTARAWRRASRAGYDAACGRGDAP